MSLITNFFSILYRNFRIEQQHGGEFSEQTAVAAARNSSNAVPQQSISGGGGGRAFQPRKLAEMELLSLKQISAMSGNDTPPPP